MPINLQWGNLPDDPKDERAKRLGIYYIPVEKRLGECKHELPAPADGAPMYPHYRCLRCSADRARKKDQYSYALANYHRADFLEAGTPNSREWAEVLGAEIYVDTRDICSDQHKPTGRRRTSDDACIDCIERATIAPVEPVKAAEPTKAEPTKQAKPKKSRPASKSTERRRKFASGLRRKQVNRKGKITYAWHHCCKRCGHFLSRTKKYGHRGALPGKFHDDWTPVIGWIWDAEYCVACVKSNTAQTKKRRQATQAVIKARKSSDSAMLIDRFVPFTKEAAIDAGQSTYWSDSPCIKTRDDHRNAEYGNRTERRTSSNGCAACERERDRKRKSKGGIENGTYEGAKKPARTCECLQSPYGPRAARGHAYQG